jgi:hypothetical protein
MNEKSQYIKIILTICGSEYLPKAMGSIKSVIILSSKKIHFIIFTYNTEVNSKLNSLVMNLKSRDNIFNFFNLSSF